MSGYTLVVIVGTAVFVRAFLSNDIESWNSDLAFLVLLFRSSSQLELPMVPSLSSLIDMVHPLTIANFRRQKGRLHLPFCDEWFLNSLVFCAVICAVCLCVFLNLAVYRMFVILVLHLFALQEFLPSIKCGRLRPLALDFH